MGYSLLVPGRPPKKTAVPRILRFGDRVTRGLHLNLRSHPRELRRHTRRHLHERTNLERFRASVTQLRWVE
jgi:hypothetical protein